MKKMIQTSLFSLTAFFISANASAKCYPPETSYSFEIDQIVTEEGEEVFRCQEKAAMPCSNGNEIISYRFVAEALELEDLPHKCFEEE